MKRERFKHLILRYRNAFDFLIGLIKSSAECGYEVKNVML